MCLFVQRPCSISKMVFCHPWICILVLMPSFYLHSHWNLAGLSLPLKHFTLQCPWEEDFSSGETVLWLRSLLTCSGTRLFQSQECRTACTSLVKAATSFFNPYVTVRCPRRKGHKMMCPSEMYKTSWKGVLAPHSEVVHVMQIQFPTTASSVPNAASHGLQPRSPNSLHDGWVNSNWPCRLSRRCFFFPLVSMVVEHLLVKFD